MSLEYAILGFLQYDPRSGYDLKRIFDTSVQHFWPADQAQIYRTLARLAEKGWAEQEIVPQEDRPDRKLYHITETGRAALRQWLVTPLAMEPNRSPELIQVFFAGQLSDDEALAIFERGAAIFRAILATYDQVPAQAQTYIDQVHSPRESFFWLLTLDMGMHMARAQLAWMEKVIAMIKNKEVPSA